MSDLEPRLADLLRRVAPAPPTTLDEGRRLAIQADARQTWFRNRSRRRWALMGSGLAALLVAGLAGWTIRSLIDEPRTGEQPVVAAAAPPSQLAPVSMPVLSERQDAAKAETAASGHLATAKQDDAPAMADGMAFSATAGEADALAAAPTPMAAAAGQRAEAELAPASSAPASAPVVTTRGTRERAPAEAGMEAKRLAPAAPAAPAAAAPAPAKPMAAMAADAEPVRIIIPANAPRYGQLLLARAVLEAADTWSPDERRQALRSARDLIAGIDHPSARELRQRLDAALAR